MISQAQTSAAPQEVVVGTNPDSIINVIGYFCKNDSIDYWISETEWKVNNGDTIKTAGVSSKVRIVVTDSTSTGYKMKYTFLDCVGDTAVDKGLGAFQNKIVEKLGKKVVGTTIEFETDEFGHITKFNNLGKIKKQAKGLYKDCMNEFVNVDEIKALKDMGIDMKKLTRQLSPYHIKFSIYMVAVQYIRNECFRQLLYIDKQANDCLRSLRQRAGTVKNISQQRQLHAERNRVVSYLETV